LKKIAFIVPDLGGGGAEKALLVLANKFSEKHKVIIVLFKKKGVFLDFVSDKINIISLKKNHKNLLHIPLLLLKLRKSLKNSDIIFCGFQLFTEFYVLLSLFGLNKKIIPVIQTNVSFMMKKINIYNYLSRKIIGFLYNRMDKIVCASKGIKSDIINNLFVKENKLKVIYNPLYFFDQNEGKIIYYFEKPIFITLARLSYQKRIDTTIKAFNEFLKVKKHGSLLILGDGEEKENLIKLAKKYNISEKVYFKGFVHNISDYLRCSDVFLLTSDVEGFGNVLIEAMYYGLPVISTNCTGPCEVLENGKYGIIVNKGDYKKISEKMIFLTENCKILNDIKRKGKARVKEFDIDKIYDEYEKIL